MNILILQETDWLKRGPHTQHHIFERLSRNPNIKIFVLDYDIDKNMKSNSIFIRRSIYTGINRTIKGAKVKVIRTAHLQIPFLRRISSLLTNAIELIKIMRQNKPDVIISFSLSNGLIGLLFSRIFNIPFIFYYIDLLHELVPFKYGKYIARFVSKLLFKYSDLIITVTKLLYDFILREGCSKKKVKILFNGISLKNTIVSSKKLDMLKFKFNITDDDFIIFFMGYLYDFAGLKEIIEYYNDDVKKGKLKLKFLIVGDGGIFNELKTQIKELNAKWVILTGKVPFFEIPKYIAISDLCLMSFKLNEITRKITPIKVLEYMAMKKPVLSNKLPSIFLEIGENKGIIYGNNQKDLIDKIRELIPHKNKLRDIGMKGYFFVKEKYSWKSIINEFKKILLELIYRQQKNL
ncbi:MAG: glycosyltransferase [Promethearchaeota archaeon]